MNEYLQSTKRKLDTNDFVALTLVLGNESCDLDSAVCALVYAAFLNWQYDQLKCKICTRKYRDEVTHKDDIFVPILNVDKEDFCLKTEVTYCLKGNGVEEGHLFFRNDYNLKELISTHKPSVVLVDHHVLAQDVEFLTPYVDDIIDHRPYDKSMWKYKDATRSTIEVVGSCATLVCSRLRELASHTGGVEEFFKLHPVCAELLYNTIILDTVNFSKDLNKGTPLDEEMVGLLEAALDVGNADDARESKLAELVNARKDVSSLTAAQLLRKDVKIIGRILAPSFPIPVSEFLQRPKVEEAMSEALRLTSCDILVTLGMKLDGAVTRDLAVFATDDLIDDANKLATLLESWSRPSLSLLPLATNIRNCRYYQQNNLAASRKQVVPALNEFLNLNKTPTS